MNRNYILICISLFLWGLGESMFFIFQPLYLEQWGASPVLIGTLLSANGIAMSLAMLPAGYLSDRLGPRPLMWVSWVIGMMAAWGMALANSLPLFVTAMVIYFSTGFAIPPMSSYVVNVRGKLSVERALTFFSVMYNLGAVLGPSIGGWIGSVYNLKTIYTFSAIAFMISVLVIFFIQKISTTSASNLDERPKSRGFSPRFWIFITLSAATVFVMYLSQPLNSNFLQNIRGLDIATIGRLGTIGNLGNTIIMLVLGSIPAYYGILASTFLVGLFALFIWKGTNTAWYGIGFFLFGGFRLGRSMLAAFGRHLVEPNKLGLAFGFLESANSFSIILAPLLAGFLYAKNPESIYQVSIILVGVILILNALILFRIQSGKSDAHKNVITESNQQ